MTFFAVLTSTTTTFRLFRWSTTTHTKDLSCISCLLTMDMFVNWNRFLSGTIGMFGATGRIACKCDACSLFVGKPLSVRDTDRTRAPHPTRACPPKDGRFCARALHRHADRPRGQHVDHLAPCRRLAHHIAKLGCLAPDRHDAALHHPLRDLPCLRPAPMRRADFGRSRHADARRSGEHARAGRRGPSGLRRLHSHAETPASRGCWRRRPSSSPQTKARS